MSVPGIPNKLIKIPVRKALTEQRKFWDIVIGELGGVDCIYTNKRLIIGDYAVEHFLPYAFVYNPFRQLHGIMDLKLC